MGYSTTIPWCHHTFNAWRGCVHVSEGCANCYAERDSKRNPRVLGEWGAAARRAIAGESYWRKPFQWDRLAHDAGERRRVFALSLGDWLELRKDLHIARARLLGTIAGTPNIDWLLLTKRAENWRSALGAAWRISARAPGPSCVPMVADWLDGKPPANVWVGISAENHRWYLERVEHLRQIPAAVRFVSAEPLLGDLTLPRGRLDLTAVDWLILGGESGYDEKVRPCRTWWFENAIEACRNQGVAPYVKQLGSWIETSHHESADALDEFPGMPRLSQGRLWDGNARVHLQHPRGEDPEEWPIHLRIREVPR